MRRGFNVSVCMFCFMSAKRLVSWAGLEKRFIYEKGFLFLFYVCVCMFCFLFAK